MCEKIDYFSVFAKDAFGTKDHQKTKKSFKTPTLLLSGGIVMKFKLFFILAISTKEDDISYGYILSHFQDIPASDESLQNALKAVWKTLCGSEKGLVEKQRMIYSLFSFVDRYSWSKMQLKSIRITFSRFC